MTAATAKKDAPEAQSIEELDQQSQLYLQRQNFTGTAQCCAQILERDPDNLAALNRLGVAEAMRGRIPEAIATFEKALAIDPSRKDIKTNLDKLVTIRASQEGDHRSVQDSLRALADLAEQAKGDPELTVSVISEAMALGMRLSQANQRQCIDAIRIGLKVQSNPLYGQVDLNNYLLRFNEKAQLSDFSRDLTPEQLGKHLLVACFPKSGSTLMKRLLCDATGYAETQFAPAFLQNEQEIYLPLVLANARENRVIQQHCRATVPNLHILQAFNIKPVVLVRNIYDVLLSWKEFLDGGAHINSFFPHYDELSDEQRLALVVDDRAPWYLSFFASWQHAETTGQIEATWMTYRQLTADPTAALEGILEFYGIRADPVRLARATQMVNRDTGATRFNKGKVGRGRAAFTDAQVEQIQRLAGCYPGVDFSLIGL